MKLVSLGKVAVATAGTIAQVTTDASIMAHVVYVDLVPGNTGDIHVGLSTLVKATLVGCLGVLTKASPDTWRKEFRAPKGNSIQVSQFYLDAGTNGDGAIVSYGII